jgi:ankyrin repeat protein
MKTARAKLLSAASGNQIPEVKEVIENAPLLNINWILRGSGLAALHCAAQKGHLEVVRLLLAHPLVNVNRKTHDGETPLLLACDGGHTEVVRVLLKDSRVKLDLADWERMTPLMCASCEGHLEIVKLLLADGRKLGHEGEDKHGGTALDGAHTMKLFPYSRTSAVILSKPVTELRWSLECLVPLPQSCLPCWFSFAKTC